MINGVSVHVEMNVLVNVTLYKYISKHYYAGNRISKFSLQ